MPKAKFNEKKPTLIRLACENCKITTWVWIEYPLECPICRIIDDWEDSNLYLQEDFATMPDPILESNQFL